MPPKLSYGLNLPNKTGAKPGAPTGQKRKKTIFDSDSEDESTNGQTNGTEEISTVGGLEVPSQPAPAAKPKSSPAALPLKKTTLSGVPKPNVKPLNKASIFADDGEEEESQDGGLRLGMNPSKSKPQSQGQGQGNEYANLAAMHSSKKHAQQAQELDPSIYSYDAVYDSLHAKPDKAATAEKANEGPRYMTSLLRSAEVRKRDQLRAKDRLLAKEREAEGDEFADKEKFVTSAYKAQQEELRKIEEEEEQREREEEERRRKNGGSGMVDFYRDMLSKGEQRHEETLKAAEETTQRVKAGELPQETDVPKEKSENQVAEELNARGAKVAVNEEGQVVDKRQLLSAGLNVAPKPKPQPSTAARAETRPAAVKPRDAGFQTGRAGQRARQTEMIAQQLEDQARQEEEAEATRQNEIAERSRSQRTEKNVSSAKERYLARKREREEAAKAKGS